MMTSRPIQYLDLGLGVVFCDLVNIRANGPDVGSTVFDGACMYLIS